MALPKGYVEMIFEKLFGKKEYFGVGGLQGLVPVLDAVREGLAIHIQANLALL